MCEGAELYRRLAKEAVRAALRARSARSEVVSRYPYVIGASGLYSLYDNVYKEQKEIAKTLGMKSSCMTGSVTGKTKDHMFKKLLEEIRNDESRGGYEQENIFW